MRGEIVPLILIPRFTGLVGDQDFATAPLEVSAYNFATITLWRGPLAADPGTSPTYSAVFEQSHDGDTWFVLPMGPGGGGGFDPAPSTTGTGSMSMQVYFLRRWFRVRIELRGTNVGVTTWVTGNLEFRVS